MVKHLSRCTCEEYSKEIVWFVWDSLEFGHVDVFGASTEGTIALKSLFPRNAILTKCDNILLRF